MYLIERVFEAENLLYNLFITLWWKNFDAVCITASCYKIQNRRKHVHCTYNNNAYIVVMCCSRMGLVSFIFNFFVWIGIRKKYFFAHLWNQIYVSIFNSPHTLLMRNVCSFIHFIWMSDWTENIADSKYVHKLCNTIIRQHTNYSIY